MTEDTPCASESNEASATDEGEFSKLVAEVKRSIARSRELWASAGFDDRRKVESAREILDLESQTEYDLVVGAERRELLRQRRVAVEKKEAPKPVRDSVKPKRTRISI
ncbi:MAG: hypothetical protein AAGA96_11760 [Verrucomicrobiota bacterium]